MSFLSRRSHSSSGHYRSNYHGKDYYKRSHDSGGGILGAIFRALFGSRNHSYSHSHRHYNNHKRHKHRHSSWS